MTRRRALIVSGLTAATLALAVVPAPAHASTLAAESAGVSSAWWWMLLLLLPAVALGVAALRGRDDYDFTSVVPASGPGFPPVSDERRSRLEALASGRESNAAVAIARAEALAAAAAVPPKPGARVPSEGGAVPLPIGASRPLPNDRLRAPDGYPIKALAESGVFYRPTDDGYADIAPDLWFATTPTAEAAGFHEVEKPTA